MKTIQRCAEDNFMPARDGFWHPSFGQKTQQMFVPKSAEPPLRMELRQKIEDIFVEKWVAHFD